MIPFHNFFPAEEKVLFIVLVSVLEAMKHNEMPGHSVFCLFPTNPHIE